jgi:uncharacterized protein YqeY
MLYEQLRSDIVTAAKARDMKKVTALRTIDGAIQKVAIDGNREIDDELVAATVKKAVKDLKSANEQFAQGGRQDLVDANNEEIAILKIYLPKEMDPAALEVLVDDAIARTGAKEKRDMGKIMGVLKRHPESGQINFGLANQLIQKKLS